MNRKMIWTLALSLLVAGLAGCAEEEATNGDADEVDTDPGTGTDAGPEPGADESIDTDPGAGQDIGSEPGTQEDAPEIDADPGPGTDIGEEAPSDI